MRKSHAAVAVLAVALVTSLIGPPAGAGPQPGGLAQPAAGTADDDAAAAAFLNYDRPAEYLIHVTPDVLVPMRDGYQLTCDLYRPAATVATSAEGRFPSLVINYTGYGRRNPPLGNVVYDLARYGYNLVWCNVRGSQGTAMNSPAPNSTGQVNPWSPLEQQDNYDLIEWLAAQSYSTGDVGQIGTSYGGITTLLVAGRQQPPSLKAVIPIQGVTDFYLQFTYPGGIRNIGDTRGEWDDGCSEVVGEPTCSERIPAEWDAHPLRDEYWDERSTHPADIQAATLYIEGFRDFFMDSADVIYPALEDRDDFALLLGPWHHSTPETLAIGERPLRVQVYLAWFDMWLTDHEVPPPPKVIAFEGLPDIEAGRWRGHASWPPPDALPQRWYLAPDGGLGATPSLEAGSHSYEVADDGSSGAVSFTTQPFTEATTLSGPIRVTLGTTFTADDGNLIIEVRDIAPDGSADDMTGTSPFRSNGLGGYLKASHRLSHRALAPVVPGARYPLRLQIPSKSWTYAAGHSLQLRITSADDVVAPDAPPGTVTIDTSAAVSYVDLALSSPSLAPAVGVQVERVAGEGPTDTAVVVSQDGHPTAGTVVIGRDDVYADSLAGGPLAASLDAPLLLSTPQALSAATRSEIERLGADRAVLLGGTAALSDAVAAELAGMGLTVERHGGTNRFHTAQLLAAEVGSATGEVFVVEGEHSDPQRGWPDAISVSALAGHRGDPILLVNRDRVPDDTIAAIAALDADRVVIIGGDAAVSQATAADLAQQTGAAVRRIAGATRYETSEAVVVESGRADMDASTLWFATGTDWRDALIAGTAAAYRGQPLALLDGHSGADRTAEIIQAHRDTLHVVRLVGDTASITEAVEQRVRDLVTQTSHVQAAPA